jgi:Caudovirus prohead serine protease
MIVFTTAATRLREVVRWRAGLRDGTLNNISIGYKINKVRQLPAGNDGIPIVRVEDYEIIEVSCVGTPADRDAQVLRKYECEWVSVWPPHSLKLCPTSRSRPAACHYGEAQAAPQARDDCAGAALDEAAREARLAERALPTPERR